MKKRIIKTKKIKEKIIDLIYQANFFLPSEVEKKFKFFLDQESNQLARETFKIILENSVLAKKEQIPLCQDCGQVIVFLEIGQAVVFEGKILSEVINEAVKKAYQKFYLRKSVVGDPLQRINTMTNTPAIIHFDLVRGHKVKIMVYLKGGGSENMSALKMFRPTDSPETIIDYIEEAVFTAGPNPCPPIFLGIGLGGTADLALLNAKKAVCQGVSYKNSDPFYHDLELKIMKRLNKTKIGPLGLGGKTTVAGVYIKQAPTHLATLPVALNLNCHSLRYKQVII